MSDIRNFIDENDISFAEGERNSSVTTLIGYAQHLGLSKNDLTRELSSEISDDSFISQEVNRLWTYCENNNYKAFWKKRIAKQRYKF